MAINKVFLAGHLTRDPELRTTAKGTPVLSFGIAVNERVQNQQTGEWEDRANFFDCTMFGARAESLSRFLSKGNKVSIEGRLRWNQWERDGQKRSKIEVIVDEIEFLSRNDGSRGGAPMQQSAPQPQAMPVQQAPAPVATPVVDASVYDEDIPF